MKKKNEVRIIKIRADQGHVQSICGLMYISKRLGTNKRVNAYEYSVCICTDYLPHRNHTITDSVSRGHEKLSGIELTATAPN